MGGFSRHREQVLTDCIQNRHLNLHMEALGGGLIGFTPLPHTHHTICGVRFESRNKNTQSITISPFKFENLTSALASQASTYQRKKIGKSCENRIYDAYLYAAKANKFEFCAWILLNNLSKIKKEKISKLRNLSVNKRKN